MTLFICAAIAIVVVVSLLLIYMEHEWGFVLGGSMAVILVVSYFSAEFLLRAPLVALLPQGAGLLDVMALVAGILVVLAIVAIAYLAGRRNASRKMEQKL
jgi:hypothetical protein